MALYTYALHALLSWTLLLGQLPCPVLLVSDDRIMRSHRANKSVESQ
jgi:hypothetical protein